MAPPVTLTAARQLRISTGFPDPYAFENAQRYDWPPERITRLTSSRKSFAARAQPHYPGQDRPFLYPGDVFVTGTVAGERGQKVTGSRMMGHVMQWPPPRPRPSSAPTMVMTSTPALRSSVLVWVLRS